MRAAVALLQSGDFASGVATLEECVAAWPNEPEPHGHLAWAFFVKRRYSEARERYLALRRIQPDNPEIEFRLLQIDWMSGEKSTDLLDRLRKAARAIPQASDVWTWLSDVADVYPDASGRKAVQEDALRLFPEQSVFGVRLARARANCRRERARRVFEWIGLRRLAKLAFQSTTIRRMLIEQAGDSGRSVAIELADWHDKGSKRAEFPQSPVWMRPENFAAYFEKDPPAWWKWFRERLPEPSGKSLLDIGAGPGFIGHHFLAHGYAVTALSGNEAELEECRARGMDALKAEMHAIPVPAKRFDAALASHVLEHSIVPFVLLREIHRVLKDDGLLFVNLPYPIEGNPALVQPECYNAREDRCEFEVDLATRSTKDPELPYYSYGVEHHVFVLTHWQWRWLFRLAGFKTLHATLDVCAENRLVGIEDLDKEPELLKKAKNQLFILQKTNLPE